MGDKDAAATAVAKPVPTSMANQSISSAPEVARSSPQAATAILPEQFADEHEDTRFMRMALDEARKAKHAREVPVGCVFVDRALGTVLARGGNCTNATRCGTRHCELVAADKVLQEFGRHIFSKCTLYVTLEPCLMCAGALQLLGVPRVVFGGANARFGGCGGVFAVHEMRAEEKQSGVGVDAPRGALHGFQCRGGVLGDEAVALLKEFYASGNPGAPDEKRHRPLVPEAPAVHSAVDAETPPPAEQPSARVHRSL
eukprot:TRINITY_DN25656_c0_g1_i1.p1 TRINITY_DN25656_c0_g1~~TRINITY_DN25656_c0_g1_i1.p1  ORF type:complete len:256 (-),score=47.13 TRINITY_DN25656_c0_g1_i1:257-1024(-)